MPFPTDEELWKPLQAQARELLDKGSRKHLFLSEAQAFEDPVTWSVDYDKQDQFRAVRTTWREAFDHRRIADVPRLARLKIKDPIEPTIETTIVTVSRDWLNAIVLELSRIAIPLAGSGRVGCDGCSYRLGVELGFERIDLSWWCDGPPAWLPVTRWYMARWRELSELADKGARQQSAPT